MGNRVVQIKLRAAREKVAANLDLALEYVHNPELEDKFFKQALAAEVLVAKLERKV
jgi:hypothetical protein